MTLDLTPAQRRALRARAHKLKATVTVGQAGLSPAVLAELNRAVECHELVKVKVAAGGREEREAMLSEMCDALGAAPVQRIGRILVIFRQNPEASATREERETRGRAAPARRGGGPAAASRRLKRPPSRAG